MIRLKAQTERSGAHTTERLAQLRPAGYTRTGAAIRFAARLLAEDMRLSNQLLVVITDGFAYDHDYEGRYARADTRMALQEARAAGHGCVCLCIGGEDSEQLREIFGVSLLQVKPGEDWSLGIGATCGRALRDVRFKRQKS